MLREQGLSPVDIAARRKVSLNTMLGYNDELVGRGLIRRSDVLFSVARDARQPVMERLRDGKSRTPSAIASRLERRGVTVDLDVVEVVRRYADAANALGDMYEDVRAIEVWLHKLVRQALEARFGTEETGWWRQGIPVAIRVKCQTRREEDRTDQPSDPYAYTDLLDLKGIVERRWLVVSSYLPKEVSSDKPRVLDDLEHLNQIRRIVMQPGRGTPPTQEEFEFTHSLKTRLGLC
jgi:hypothetical protein